MKKFALAFFFFSAASGLAANAFGAAFPGDSTGFSGDIGVSPIAATVGGAAPSPCVWQDVADARTLNQRYQNLTGRPMWVVVSGDQFSPIFIGYENSQEVAQSPYQNDLGYVVATGPLSFEVGPGDFYSVSPAGGGMPGPRPPRGFVSWLECR